MATRNRNNLHPTSVQTYRVPFYAADWIRSRQIRSTVQDSTAKKEEEEEEEEEIEQVEEGEGEGENKSSFPTPTAADESYVVLAGGGGEGRSGIQNAVVVARFDAASISLSPDPVFKLELGSELPYRIAVHPGGDGVVCAFPNSCRLFEWNEVRDNERRTIALNSSEKVLSKLEDVGQQLAMVFNSDGTVLAVGGEDGNLRVFEWPSMKVILNEAQAHASLKDLCFSPDGKFLVSLGGRGPGRVWNVTSATAVASLAKETDEIFASCRFSPISETTRVLYIATITGKGATIVTWDTNLWKRVTSKLVIRDPVSSFNVSPDGRMLAIGTPQGDVLLVSSINMRVCTLVKKAHIGIVTAVAFTHDSRALVSVSMDSNARVMAIKGEQNVQSEAFRFWIFAIVLMIAMAAYYFYNGLRPFSGYKY